MIFFEWYNLRVEICVNNTISFISVGAIRCIKNLTLHNASVLSINAGEHWLGIAAADNSMSLYHRPQERLGGLSTTGSKMAGWQLYRTPQKAVAMVFLLTVSALYLWSIYSLGCCYFFILKFFVHILVILL